MEKTIIIKGPKNYLKGAIALKIAKGKEVARVMADNIQCGLSDTQFALFENLRWETKTLYGQSPEKFLIIIFDLTSINQLRKIINLSKIMYRPMYGRGFIEIDRPEIIILTTLDFNSELDKSKYNVIDLYRENPDKYLNEAQ